MPKIYDITTKWCYDWSGGHFDTHIHIHLPRTSPARITCDDQSSSHNLITLQCCGCCMQCCWCSHHHSMETYNRSSLMHWHHIDHMDGYLCTWCRWICLGAAHDVVAAYGVFLWTGRVCSGFLAATARGRPTLQSILAILLLVNVAPGPVCSLHIHKNGLLSN